MLFFRIFRVFRGKKRGIPRTLKAIWYEMLREQSHGLFFMPILNRFVNQDIQNLQTVPSPAFLLKNKISLLLYISGFPKYIWRSGETGRSGFPHICAEDKS